MPDFATNLWAPWRMEYIAGLHGAEGAEPCFLCRYWASPADDTANLVIGRGPSTLVVMNRFPYAGGHLLVTPAAHEAALESLPLETQHELARMLGECVRVLKAALQPQGFNLGMNLERCAGAGLPGHVHWHIVPRWNGDTNFMTVVGDARVIPEALQRTRARLVEAARTLGVAFQPAG